MLIGVMEGTFGLAVQVARRYGWFVRAGIDKLETCRVDDEKTLLRELENGSVSLGRMSAERALQARYAGSPIRIVAAFDNTMVHVLVGGKEIVCANQLIGRKVGYNTPGDYTESYVIAALKYLGLSPAQVQLVGCGKSEERRKALRAGEIAATIVSQKPAQKLRDDGFTWIAEMADVFPEYQNKVLAASERSVTEEAKELSGVLAGLIRAYRYLGTAESDAPFEPMVAEAPWLGEPAELREQLAVRRKRCPVDDGMPSIKGLMMVALENFPDLPSETRERLVLDALELAALKQAHAALGIA